MAEEYKGVETVFTEWLWSLKEAPPFEHNAIREAFEAGFRAGQMDSRRAWQQNGQRIQLLRWDGHQLIREELTADQYELAAAREAYRLYGIATILPDGAIYCPACDKFHPKNVAEMPNG